MMQEKEVANSGGNNQRLWTLKELDAIRSMANLGAEVIAESLDRSVWSVRKMAYRMRISLRRTGNRTGLVMGQPRGVSWAAGVHESGRIAALKQLRELIRHGKVDIENLELQARRELRLIEGAPLCPNCVARPQEVEKTGLCTDCHFRSLADAHRSNIERQGAQRELWRERQRKVRRKQRGEQ